MGIALWCILLAFELLPGITLDTWGVLLFGVAGFLIGATRLRRALTVALWIGAAAVVVVTLTPLSNVVARRWVRVDILPDSSLPAVVVLSESVNPNSTMSGGGLDHLLSGLGLIREGKAGMLVTTNVEQEFPRTTVSSITDQSRVLALFGGRVSWLHTARTRSTRDEAVQSAALLMPRGVRRIAVVTSPMHTRRACSAFEAVGFSVTCVPALVRSPGGADPAPWPRDRLRVFGDWIYELVGTAKYAAAGWLKSS